MAVTGSRKGVTNLAIPLMIVAFLLMGGFLYWLNITAEPTTISAEAADTTAGAAADESGATTVAMADFGTDPTTYEGQTIRIPSVEVVSRLGEQAFWTQLPNETPYLVRIGPDLTEQGLTLSTNDVATIVGTVHMMSDSVLDAWQADGVFSNDTQRIEAEFATSFLEAENIQLQGGSGGND